MSIVNLNEVRRAWTSRYGPSQARRMLAGAGMAYDSASGLRSWSRRPARDQEEEPDERLEAIKVFIKNRLQPADWNRLQQMMAALSDGGGEQEGEGEGEDRGRRFASDARTDGYFDMFPANSAVKVW